MKKDFKQLERIVRGFSNHRRIRILEVLDHRPDLDLRTLAQACGTNMKTGSEHARRLAIAGLILKRAKGARVLHALSGRGRKILMFLRTLE